jgi:hypothetical protein
MSLDEKLNALPHKSYSNTAWSVDEYVKREDVRALLRELTEGPTSEYVRRADVVQVVRGESADCIGADVRANEVLSNLADRIAEGRLP